MINRFLGLIVLLALASCTPELTFQVTKAPKHNVTGVEYIMIGQVTDDMGQVIPMPKSVKGKTFSKKSTHKFVSNKPVSDLVRAYVAAGLSSSSSKLKLLNTNAGLLVGDTIPDDAKVAVLDIKVRYFEQTKRGYEDFYYVLLARNNNVPLAQKLLIAGLEMKVASDAEKNKKGFKIPTPYIEHLAAMQVEFTLTKKSDGSVLVPKQSFTDYFHRKLGGREESDYISKELQTALAEFHPAAGAADQIFSIVDKTELRFMDRQEFLAKGFHLRQHPAVALNQLDLRTTLAAQLAGDFAKTITPYQEVVELEVAGGDAQAANLINGNAYEEAINRLGSLPQPLSADDQYNMALAHEAIGEQNQAHELYQQGADAHGSDLFKQGVKRTSQP